MPGVFSKSSRPRRPGAYVNFESSSTPALLPSQGSVVACMEDHPWGPFRTPTLVSSYDEFIGIFGNYTSDLDQSVRQAFKGEAILDRGGAGAVLVYRHGSTANIATKTLQNVTPAAGLVLSAKYAGTGGNALAITVQDDPVVGANDMLLIKSGTTVLETYNYADTGITDLLTAINATSNWVVASGAVNGVKLAYVADQALIGGTDGATLVAADWTATMAALEVERFGILAPWNLTDSTILASLAAWAIGLNSKGRRFMTVIGGGLTDTATSALTRSLSINDPNFVNVGVGTVTDVDFGVMSTAQIAPRIAGILAARGENKSITMARLGGVTAINSGATASQIDQAFDGGVVVLGRDNVAAAPVRIEKALTTYTTKTNDKRPYKVFSNPKFVRTMHGIENEATEYAEQPGVLGELAVNDKTRNLIVGEIGARLRDREAREVLQPGSSVSIDQTPPPSDDDEFVALRLGLKFSRTVEQIYLTIGVG